MKKFQFFVLMLCLLFSLSNVKAEKMTVLKDVTSGTVVKNVHSDDGKHCRDVSFTYNISDVKRIAAYRTDVTVGNYSMVYYQLGAFSESTGKYCREMEVRFDDEEPVESTITNTFSGVGFFMDFDNNYCSEDCYCTISGCPVFSSYEACEKYLKTGEYDEDELISPDGIDDSGNPIYPEKFDRTIPLPQNFHWYDMTPKNGSGGVLIGNTSYFTWEDPDKVNIVSGKFNAEIQVKATIDYKTALGGKVCHLSNEDWITISKSDLDTTSHILYWLLDNGSYSPCASLSEMQLALNLALKNGYEQTGFAPASSFDEKKFYKYDFVSFKYRIRNYYISNGNKLCSAWVEKSVNDVTSVTNNDDGNNSADIKDPEGNDVSNDVDYSQDSASVSNSKETMFGWLARQIDGLDSFFSSIKKAFSSATDAGTSFIAMFKSYNTWLPETFFTMLVTGIGIVILLRILGR